MSGNQSSSAKNSTSNKFTFPAATISLESMTASPSKKLVSQKAQISHFNK
jgi:hypothetical protein